MDSEDDGYMQVEDQAKEKVKSSNKSTRTCFFLPFLQIKLTMVQSMVKQLKNMPGWLYKFFGDTVSPHS